MSVGVDPAQSNGPVNVLIAGSAPGLKGDPGVGISTAQVDAEGRLVITKTDGTQVALPLDAVIELAAMQAATTLGTSLDDIKAAVEAAASSSADAAASKSDAATSVETVRQQSAAVSALAEQTATSTSTAVNAAGVAKAVTAGAADILAQNSALAATIVNNPAEFTLLGAWDATTNTPALTSSTGTEGALYIVSVAGATVLDGVAAWGVLDGVWYHQGAWHRLDRAGYPAVAQVMRGLQSLIAGDTTFSNQTAKALALKDLAGRILMSVERDGSIRTAGDSLTLGGRMIGWDPDSRWIFKMCDAAGHVAWGVRQDGSPVFPRSAASAQLGPATITYRADEDFVVKNAAGFVLFRSSWVQKPATVDWTAEEIADRDRQQLARSALIMSGNGDLLRARPVWGISVVYDTGQSEEKGYVSLPALSVAQPYDNITFGSDPSGYRFGIDASPWTPRGGDPSPQPLVARNINQDTYEEMTIPSVLVYKPATVDVTLPPVTSGNALIQISTTDKTIDFTSGFQVGQTIQCAGFTGAAASNNESGGEWYSHYVTLTAVSAQSVTGTCDGVWYAWTPVAITGATNVRIAPLRITRDFGEQQSISALNFYRGLQLGYRGQMSDISRRLALISCCVSGTTIQQLSRGYSIPLFDRVGQSATIAKAEADKLGTTIGCFVIQFCQGGSNTDTDYDTYYPLLAQYFADVKSEIMSVFGQTVEPFIEISPISGMNLPGTGIMDVCRAQVDYVRATPGAYIPTVGYPAIDYGPHYSANGERYVGAMRAKIRHRVVTQGLAWRPLIMERASLRGQTILLDCHVPFPPMRSLPVWRGQEQVVYDDLGFGVYDTATRTRLSVSSVSIVGDTQVQIVLATAPKGAVWVTYGDSNHDGSGNIFDSDPAVSQDVYEWVEGNGAPYSEGVADLIGKPYTLANPMINYAIQTEGN